MKKFSTLIIGCIVCICSSRAYGMLNEDLMPQSPSSAGHSPRSPQIQRLIEQDKQDRQFDLKEMIPVSKVVVQKKSKVQINQQPYQINQKK